MATIQSMVVLIVLILAVFRVSFAISIETFSGDKKGPFNMFEWLRDSSANYWPYWLNEGIRCFLCVSFWVSLPAGFVIVQSPIGIVYSLAIGSGAILVYKVVSK